MNRDKQFYHDYFTANRKYLNIAQLCRDVNCNRTQMTFFLKDSYHYEAMSLEKLEAMYEIVQALANY